MKGGAFIDDLAPVFTFFKNPGNASKRNDFASIAAFYERVML